MSENKDNRIGQTALVTLVGLVVIYLLVFIVFLVDYKFFHNWLAQHIPHRGIEVLDIIYWPLIKLCELLGIIK